MTKGGKLSQRQRLVIVSKDSFLGKGEKQTKQIKRDESTSNLSTLKGSGEGDMCQANHDLMCYLQHTVEHFENTDLYGGISNFGL